VRPILLATDDSNDVFAIWAHHKQCGIQNRVEVLSDGMDALRYLEGDRVRCPLPALLIASLRMPEMGGLELLERLAAKELDFSTVLLIDDRDHDLELVAAAYRLRVDSFLRRPIDKNEFCRLMSRFLPITIENCQGIVQPSGFKPRARL
jgi:two-component system response regulator